MSSLMIFCPRISISVIFEKRLTHGPTDRRTDGRTDGHDRDAWTHLKSIQHILYVLFTAYRKKQRLRTTDRQTD